MCKLNNKKVKHFKYYLKKRKKISLIALEIILQRQHFYRKSLLGFDNNCTLTNSSATPIHLFVIVML